jgi:hypothetical protein
MNDSDNPNLNNAAHDQRERWEAMRQEMDAKADKLNAEQRMHYNDGLKNFSEEADAAGDWLEADWDQFNARVKKWWNGFEVEADEAI